MLSRQTWQKGGATEMVINIRAFPDALHRRVKIRVAVEGITPEDLSIKTLTEYRKKA